jgi:hypothetical protein
MKCMARFGLPQVAVSSKGHPLAVAGLICKHLGRRL